MYSGLIMLVLVVSGVVFARREILLLDPKAVAIDEDGPTVAPNDKKDNEDEVPNAEQPPH